MVKKSSASSSTASPASFESAMAELTQLVARMEDGELTLQASIEAYARGSELVRYCAAQLDTVEQQVNILNDDLLKPFQAGKINDDDELI